MARKNTHGMSIIRTCPGCGKAFLLSPRWEAEGGLAKLTYHGYVYYCLECSQKLLNHTRRGPGQTGRR